MADNPNIRVEITDARELHCFRLLLNAAPGAPGEERQPIEVMLHATALVDLIHKASVALCAWMAQTSGELLEKRRRELQALDDERPRVELVSEDEARRVGLL